MANVASIWTSVDGGKDVGFDLTLDDGRVLSGEVTLLPHEDGSPGYGAWGAPDHWLDGNTLANLRGLPDTEFIATLNAIEAACAAEVQS